MTGALRGDERSVIYGQKTIDYNLFYLERKSLEIAVHPDSTVIVKAPMDSDISLIEKKIIKRARWILKQLNYFKQFTPKTPDRYYVNGETHLYLGKQYRLKITQGNDNNVKLNRGFFEITCRDEPTPDIAKKLLRKWYREKAALQFNDSLNRCWPKFHKSVFTRPEISLKTMRKRWGSLSNEGILILNTELVKAPKECIDYVVTHELCHLKYHDHSSEFYKLLDSINPGWEKIKHKLELSMI
ncbi:MAG: SprT family zinc-dependent metalloprotease [Desulfuromonadales bacterium]|nr:SprT family zinc-dependent metalloprotease [Desulfuromonadales bacterium]